MEFHSISFSNKNNKIIYNKIKRNLENIKSNYILKKIFFNLTKKKYLEIIKYNKKSQNILNITINNYKEYMDKYSSIEIEVKTVQNEHGNFINYENKESFCHIYFNDEKEEIKRNYLTKDDNVSKIKIILGYQITSFLELFKKCNCLESIYFKKFYRKYQKYV